ncbi:MAG: hypothetical protein ACT4PG_12240, partial [Panacagrimonas sp.]
MSADMMSPDTHTLAQIAEAMGITKHGAEVRAARESWPYTERPVRGGRQRLYALADLPGDVRRALAARTAPRPAPRPVAPAQDKLRALTQLSGWRREKADCGA